ncbi:MAG: ATP-binding cassette domain-containing protein [Flavobacteriaceae bacterium]|nr:ATP-binding cassette domain-containing protein [Flavobacteriaceae bacterium]
MPNLLEVQEVSKTYGNYTALNSVSLTVKKGKIFGLLGPNGAGKTSLIRIINQITMPDSGRLLFDGLPLQSKHIKQIGYLPEERGLYKSMKVGEQAVYLSQLKGLDRQEAKKRINFWFDKFNINDWRDKKINELSKGMAQKVQFIITVLHQPKLLIFDEPFSGFDPINTELIKNEILELKEKGATIIFSTHRMESVEELCDDIALINRSHLVLSGALRDIKNRYKQGIYLATLENFNTAKVAALQHEGIELMESKNHVEIGQQLLKLKIDKHTDINTLLTGLTACGTLVKFEEKIPSVNDIFIKTVKETPDA